MSAKDVDPVKAKGYIYPVRSVSYNQRDLLLYALGIGEMDLRYTYERSPKFAAFPTYPVVLGLKGNNQDVTPFKVGSGGKKIPGIPKFNPSKLLHGEQSIEILHPFPVTGGQFTSHGKLLGVYDKGKGMIMQTETFIKDAQGKSLVKLVSSVFIVGLGGFGGPKQPKQPKNKPPKRIPDAVIEYKISSSQAMLYRLSGDYNPLHIDPALAKRVGFKKPILHGLCSFGFAARAIIEAFCNKDSTLFKSMKVRFASPVFPGETLVTEMWQEGGKIIFQQKVKERNVIVISNAAAEIRNPVAKL